MLVPPLKIVNAELRFPRVTLIDPSPSHFIHIAAEIESLGGTITPIDPIMA